MTKLCSVCGTENRDEVQFCRACGTAFPPVEPPSAEDAQLALGITCDECGFQNKPGVRYCANCGVSLLGTVIVPRSRAAPTAPPDPYAGLSPPPISYPSYATVAPYPPPPLPAAGYPPAYDDPLGTPAYPDAANAALPDQEADDDTAAETDAAATAFAPQKSASNRAPLFIGLAVVALVAAGAGTWWFMGSSGGSRAGAASAPSVAAPAPVEPPAAVTAPAQATAPAFPPAASAAETAVAPPVTAPAATIPPPVAATAMPPVADPAASDPEDAEAKRLAAEKRREKAARDKLEREAKAKLLADQQREQAAAATTRAEQEATRRRAEEAQRARPTFTAPPPLALPAPVQPRGVREICAGRGTIGESICQSRECGKPEHANEAICRQVRDAEERRRNYQN